MARSFISQLGQQTAESSLDRLHKVAQRRAEDLDQKPRRDTLNKFFPEDVSRLILQLPERDQWSAIQQLAQGYGQEQGGNEDMGLEQVRQQGQLGPQGPNTVDQQLQQAIGRESQGFPIEQQVQQPAVNNREFSAQQRQSQRQRPTLGQALSLESNQGSKEDIKEAQSYVSELRKKNRRSNEINKAIGRMETYNESGKLSSPLSAALVKLIGAKGYGPDLSFLLTKESQDFDKIATGFLKYAKDYFGSRITEGEVNTYLKSVPSLVNSKDGRRLIIDQWKQLLEADKINHDAVQDIIRENGGKIPSNIEDIASQRTQPQMDRLYEKFTSLAQAGEKKVESQISSTRKTKQLPSNNSVPVGKQFRKDGKTYTNTGKSWKVS